MGKHLSAELCSCCYIMYSDLDQPMVMEVMVGFNTRSELMAVIIYDDSEEPWYNCSTAAVVNFEDAMKMAEHHKIPYWKLPDFIGECMEGWGELVNADFKQTKACFKEIVDCLIEEGCRLKIIRTYGKNGYMCT